MAETTEAVQRSDDELRITEIFHSLQGESRPVGCPTAFVRLTGCPLRCVWCDTEYAFHGGTRMRIAEIVEQWQGGVFDGGFTDLMCHVKLSIESRICWNGA